MELMDLTSEKPSDVGFMQRHGTDLPVAIARFRWDDSLIFLLYTTEMVEVTAIQFTQDQARSLTGVSAETVRHWRKTIPYLSSKGGKVARFTFADLLALAVTHELVTSFGVKIATLSVGVDSLFRLLAATGPTSLEGAVVSVTATEATMYDPGSDGIRGLPAKPALVVPLTPLMAGIQRQMLPVASVFGQSVLPFPPEAVRSRA